MSPCESEVAAKDITFHIQLGHTVTYCDEMALPEFVEDEVEFSARACSDGAVELWQNFLWKFYFVRDTIGQFLGPVNLDVIVVTRIRIPIIQSLHYFCWCCWYFKMKWKICIFCAIRTETNATPTLLLKHNYQDWHEQIRMSLLTSPVDLCYSVIVIFKYLFNSWEQNRNIKSTVSTPFLHIVISLLEPILHSYSKWS